MTELGKMMIEEGKEEQKKESAKAIMDVFNDEDIAKRMKLPIEEVRKLREEYNKNN